MENTSGDLNQAQNLKRKAPTLATPNNFSKKKMIWKEASNIFASRIGEWKKANTMLTDIEITDHKSSMASGGLFVMLRQQSFVKGQKDNAILLHSSSINKLINNLQKCATILNGRSTSKKNLHQIHNNIIQEKNVISIASKDKESGTQDNPIVIDEEKTLSTKPDCIVIDEVDINSPQSFYRRQLAQIYFVRMKKHLNDLMKEQCEGCSLGCSSQRDHECVTCDSNDYLISFFNQILERVDAVDANKECLHI